MFWSFFYFPFRHRRVRQKYRPLRIGNALRERSRLLSLYSWNQLWDRLYVWRLPERLRRSFLPIILINLSINQSTNPPIDQSIHQSINQSINQSTNRSINQSTNRLINRSIERSINQSTNFHLFRSRWVRVGQSQLRSGLWLSQHSRFVPVYAKSVPEKNAARLWAGAVPACHLRPGIWAGRWRGVSGHEWVWPTRRV